MESLSYIVFSRQIEMQMGRVLDGRNSVGKSVTMWFILGTNCK